MAYMNKDARLLEEKRMMDRWSWLVEDVEDQDSKINTAMVLENSYDHMLGEGQLSEGWLESMLNEEEVELTEAPTLSTDAGSNLIPRVMFPMIRRVYPTLIANKLVSVQPLTAPTGVIYYIVYQYTNSKGGITADDEYTGVTQQGSPAFATWYTSEKIGPYTATIGDTADSTVVSTATALTFLTAAVVAGDTTTIIKRVEVYDANTGAGGTQYTTSMFPSSTDASPVWSGTYNTYYDYDTSAIVLRDGTNSQSQWESGDNVVCYLVYNQENLSTMPEMEFSISSETVTATERKLKVRWTKEAEQDMKAYHKIDVEGELVKVASMEMNYEVDREIITFISDRVVTGLSQIHDWTADAPNTGNNTAGNYLDRHRALAEKIHRIGALIATYNRQGPASWAVVSPTVAAVLQMLPDFKGEINGGNFNIFEAGKLGGRLAIYVDPNRTGTIADEILLGYKSQATTYGAGAVYAPYTNWMSNTITDPNNFNSVRGFFSRYALKMVPRGQWFYGKLSITNFR
tara:strand:- start:1343 stop:2887 length:1545 start_codon:yes stop_codon:yes gene_type:complete